MKSLIRKHSIVINGRAKSISIEDAFWEPLQEIATDRGTSVANHCRPVERGWYPEFPPLFNELTPILFGVDLNSKWRFPVTFRTFSDRERHRELWPNAVFANHGFYPMVEFLSSGCEVRRR
jgi:hypothetical protein